METINELIARILPLAKTINVPGDITPELQGSINSVAAAGGELSEISTQLLILSSRGEITEDEYQRVGLHFIKEKYEKIDD